MDTGRKNKQVLILAPQGFEDIEIAAFTDVLGWTRVLKEVQSLDVVIAGFKINVRSKHNLKIKTDALIKDIVVRDYDALVIPGGFNDSGWTEIYDKKIGAIIQEAYENGAIIVCMCVGALPVARSGILKGKKATTYASSRRHDNLQTLRECGALPVKKRIVITDRIITNRGPDTSLDVAFTLIGMLNGKQDMERVRKALMFS